MRILVDGNHLASRTRHTSVAALMTSDGRRSGVIHGVFKSLSWLTHLVSSPMSDLVVAWDGGKSTKRMELCPEYKANRHKDLETEEERKELQAYYRQTEAIQLMLPTLGCQSIRVRGVEADDIISYIGCSDETPTYVFSGDKDFHQLAGGNIVLIDPKKTRRHVPELLNEWGAKNISDIVVIRAIIGDASDNLPGVKGLGPKRAPIALYDAESTQHKKLQENIDVVQKNIKMMKLPRTKMEMRDLYSIAELYELDRQRVFPHEVCPEAFFDHCDKWELSELAELIRW